MIDSTSKASITLLLAAGMSAQQSKIKKLVLSYSYVLSQTYEKMCRK